MVKSKMDEGNPQKLSNPATNISHSEKNVSTNQDIFQKFREFDENDMKREILTTSLDSIEKILFAEFYGKEPQKLVKSKLLKHQKKPKDDNIEKAIEKFFSSYVINIQNLNRISKYLKSFQHDEKISDEISKKKSFRVKGLSWTQQQETEKLSKEIRKRRDTQEVWSAPGKYHPDKIYFKEQLTNKDVTFYKFGRKTERLKPANTSCTPGPGNYGNDSTLHIPITGWRKPTTHIPPFEWLPWGDGRGEKMKPDRLPPNTYTVKYHNSIDEKIKRRVTKRGPYDVFTGPRDETTIKNHFAPRKLTEVNSSLVTFPGLVEKLQEHGLKEHGRWSNVDRDLKTSIAKDKVPAPNLYQPDALDAPPVKQNKYPFNSSIAWVWSSPSKKIMPGPGRYNVCKAKRGKYAGHHNLFRSQSERFPVVMNY